jgi:glycosyltransferase involved in cell wall biosynthesis
MLWKGFGINSTMIPMPCEEFPLRGCSVPERHEEGDVRVLWVGRISEEKRLEWLLDVAEKCPEIHFDVVGACNTDSEYASALAKHASEIPNVEMHGRILHSEMAAYYQRCHVLCCTSGYEGFPNTFLEAWSLGVPVVSTVDPDGIISRYNLGWTAETINDLANALREATTDVKKYRGLAESARDYYVKNHTLDSCMERFACVVKNLCR